MGMLADQPEGIFRESFSERLITFRGVMQIVLDGLSPAVDTIIEVVCIDPRKPGVGIRHLAQQMP